MDSDLLVGSKCVSKFTYSGGSLDRFGRLGRVNEAIANKEIDVREYVLHEFDNDQQKRIDQALKKVDNIIIELIKNDLDSTMNKFN